MATPLPLVTLPQTVPLRPERQTQANIPNEKAERDAVLAHVRSYLEASPLVPPLSMKELRQEAALLCNAYDVNPQYIEYIAVLLSNETWRETLASIPYERRLLLLPKCLRVEDRCPAPFDEFGLLCKKCGLCTIQDLQSEAERLGYAVLVAEGSPIVMAIIETGKIDAIVGVSCLNVLEKVYSYMEAAAVPGIAIPLLQDDCIDTNVDVDWVWDGIHLTSDDKTRRMDLVALREEVDSWFTRESLAEILGQPEGETEEIAHDWLARAGKRWRPFLTVALHQALKEDPGGEIPMGLRQVAVAVECFHKASLVHDDIEDDDAMRYGSETLHELHGVPVALNVGDYLLGEGYRLLAESDAAPEIRVKMLQVAAEGHRTLSLGQGAELCWARQPKPLRGTQVLDIFRRKTSPAFETALRIGAYYSVGTGEDDDLHEALHAYSDALGMAYQIRDDLHDLAASREAGELPEARPTLPWSLLWEKGGKKRQAEVSDAWFGKDEFGEDECARDADPARVYELMDELGIEERARELLEAYKEEATRVLRRLDNAGAKGLLRRTVGKIFNDLEIKGWCNEFETRNAASVEAGAPIAG